MLSFSSPAEALLTAFWHQRLEALAQSQGCHKAWLHWSDSPSQTLQTPPAEASPPEEEEPLFLFTVPHHTPSLSSALPLPTAVEEEPMAGPSVAWPANTDPLEESVHYFLGLQPQLADNQPPKPLWATADTYFYEATHGWPSALTPLVPWLGKQGLEAVALVPLPAGPLVRGAPRWLVLAYEGPHQWHPPQREALQAVMEYWCREWQQQQAHEPPSTVAPLPNTVAPHPTATLTPNAEDLPPGQHRWVWLGQLAGGLLHDMAVPLSALSSSVQSLQPLVAHQAAPAGALAAQALQATQRLEALLQATRQLTQGPQHQGAGQPPVLADGVALLEQAQLLLKHKAPEGLQVVYEGPPTAQLQTQPQWVLQVLMNGLLNAYQALEGQAKVPVVPPRLQQVRCRLQHVPLAQRMAWQWCVEDNGPGMPPEVLARAMEAGFSTKLGHGGSGLGLSFCRQVVEEVLGGTLALHSQVGQGTQFILTLPSTV